MATIKSYTSLEQAKELLKILPHQSADMSFNVEKGYEVIMHPYMTSNWIGVPCWSLTALLSVLPSHFYDETGRKTLGMSKGDTYYYIFYENKNSYLEQGADNPVDACVDMIIKLNELNLL